MHHHATLSAAGVLLSLTLLAGCGPGEAGTNSGAQPSSTSSSTTHDEHSAAQSEAIPLTQHLEFVGLSARTPEHWQAETPANTMRIAQFRIPAHPGEAGNGVAELVIFAFGPGQGGGVTDNINRWQRQVTDADGTPVPPIVRSITADGMTITIVESTGTYQSGMPGDTDTRDDTTVINVMIDAPEQSVFLKFMGPRATVATNRDGFMAMLETVAKHD